MPVSKTSPRSTAGRRRAPRDGSGAGHRVDLALVVERAAEDVEETAERGLATRSMSGSGGGGGGRKWSSGSSSGCSRRTTGEVGVPSRSTSKPIVGPDGASRRSRASVLGRVDVLAGRPPRARRRRARWCPGRSSATMSEPGDVVVDLAQVDVGHRAGPVVRRRCRRTRCRSARRVAPCRRRARVVPRFGALYAAMPASRSRSSSSSTRWVSTSSRRAYRRRRQAVVAARRAAPVTARSGSWHRPGRVGGRTPGWSRRSPARRGRGSRRGSCSGSSASRTRLERELGQQHRGAVRLDDVVLGLVEHQERLR